MAILPPAFMSPEAKAMIAEGDPSAATHGDGLPIDEIRKIVRQQNTSAAEWALSHYGVETRTVEIGGIRCMEIMPPHAKPDRQILYLFGGGFMMGSAFEDLPVSAALANKTSARVICPEYRLAPEHPFPAALDDISAVADKVLADNPATLLAGESAGGNLALALVHRLRAAGNPAPAAIAVLSPATDLEHTGDSQEADRDPFLAAARVREVREAYLGDTDPRQAEVSPIYGRFDETFPPTFITSGTRDMLLSGCVRLERVMREANAPVTLRVWEGMWHVFEFYPDIPEAEASLSEIAEFLERYL